MNKKDFIKKGGNWLGIVRKWIQWNCINGDRVIWGSNDVLNPPLTVSQIEKLAGEVAFVTLNHGDSKNNEQQLKTANALLSEVWKLNESCTTKDTRDDIMTRINNHLT